MLYFMCMLKLNKIDCKVKHLNYDQGNIKTEHINAA